MAAWALKPFVYRASHSKAYRTPAERLFEKILRCNTKCSVSVVV
ncbi:hypothetical protein HPTD01_2406 [Halomonas sp. TD01]|nr:hypothetical protein HPTD01_2406 [Halomonas sp. TD01]